MNKIENELALLGVARNTVTQKYIRDKKLIVGPHRAGDSSIGGI